MIYRFVIFLSVILLMGVVQAHEVGQYSAAYYLYKNRKDKDIQLTQEVESSFKNFYERDKAPSLAYGIVLDDESVLNDAFDTANIETEYPAISTTLFRIASIPKSITAEEIDLGPTRKGIQIKQLQPTKSIHEKRTQKEKLVGLAVKSAQDKLNELGKRLQKGKASQLKVQQEKPLLRNLTITTAQIIRY